MARQAAMAQADFWPLAVYLPRFYSPSRLINYDIYGCNRWT